MHFVLMESRIAMKMYHGHQDINKRFQELDKHPLLCEITYKEMLAWGIVKERIWLWTLKRVDQTFPKEESFLKYKEIKNILSKIKSIVFGFLSVLYNSILLSKENNICLIFDRRLISVQNKQMHPILGSINQWKRNRLLCIYWGDYGKAPLLPQKNKIDDFSIDKFIGCIAIVIRHCPKIDRVASNIEKIISPILSVDDSGSFKKIIADQLARFYVRRVIYRMIFKNRCVNHLIMLDADAKAAEIAAARSLNVKITEIQHGMFGPNDPEYAWKERHRHLKRYLPVADKIIVFGNFWKEALLRNKFWLDSEIKIGSYPALKLGSNISSGILNNSKCRYSLLFLSQPYLRNISIDFWKDIITEDYDFASQVNLIIKLHPIELDEQEKYRVLAQQWPGSSQIISEQQSAIAYFKNVDLVCGYTSFALIEALGLKCKPARLAGKNYDENFAQAFDLECIDRYIPKITSSGDILNILTAEIRQDEIIDQSYFFAKEAAPLSNLIARIQDEK